MDGWWKDLSRLQKIIWSDCSFISITKRHLLDGLEVRPSSPWNKSNPKNLTFWAVVSLPSISLTLSYMYHNFRLPLWTGADKRKKVEITQSSRRQNPLFLFSPARFIYLFIYLQHVPTFLIIRWYVAIFRKIYRLVTNILPFKFPLFLDVWGIPPWKGLSLLSALSPSQRNYKKLSCNTCLFPIVSFSRLKEHKWQALKLNLAAKHCICYSWRENCHVRRVKMTATQDCR